MYDWRKTNPEEKEFALALRRSRSASGEQVRKFGTALED